MPATELRGVDVNAFDLAGLYLQRAGLPNTKANRLLLAAWFRAESRASGRSSIVMYNNNPLNITTRNDYQYHVFSDNPLHFADYTSPEAGADAWYNLLKSKDRYLPILLAFRLESDYKAFARAVGNSPWGTGAPNIKRRFTDFNGVDYYTGSAIYNVYSAGYTSSPPTTDTNRTDVGIFFDKNGVPLVSFARGSILTMRDVDFIQQLMKNAGYFDADPTGLASAQFHVNMAQFFVYDKHPWTEENIAIFAAQQTGQAAEIGKAMNAVPFVGTGNAIIDWFNGLWFTKSITNKKDFGGVVLHALAVLVGGIMVYKGIGIILLDAGVIDPRTDDYEDDYDYIEDLEEELEDEEEEEEENLPAPKPVIISAPTPTVAKAASPNKTGLAASMVSNANNRKAASTVNKVAAAIPTPPSPTVSKPAAPKPPVVKPVVSTPTVPKPTIVQPVATPAASATPATTPEPMVNATAEPPKPKARSRRSPDPVIRAAAREREKIALRAKRAAIKAAEEAKKAAEATKEVTS